jgi:hypothetical protein
VLVILVAGSIAGEAQAKGKKQKPIPYFGKVTASGEWHAGGLWGATPNYQWRKKK